MKKKVYRYQDKNRIVYGTMQDLSKEVNMSVTSLTRAVKTEPTVRDYDMSYYGEVEFTINDYLNLKDELDKKSKALNKVLMRVVEVEAKRCGLEPTERAYQKWYEWAIN